MRQASHHARALAAGTAAVIEGLERRTLLAAAGDLDPLFGAEGRITTEVIGRLLSFPSAIAVQEDGSALVAGRTGVRDVILRLDPTGALDTSFGASGLAHLPYSGFVEAITVAPDGRIIIAGGQRTGNDTESTIARLMPDGIADSSFGTGGFVVTDASTGDDRFTNVLIQPDGRIVAVGDWIVRYLDDGSLDPSFSGDGKLGPTNMVFNGMLHEAIALQEDGKLLIGGSYSGVEMMMGRINLDGSIDTAFGTDGRIRTKFGDLGASVSSLLVLPDGRIVAAGESGAEFALAQYSASGILDDGFGTGGKVTFDFAAGASDRVLSISRQSDGRLVAAGLVQPQDDLGSLGLARFNADGSHDTSYGTNGRTILGAIGDRFFIPGAAVAAADDQIVIAGVVGDYGTPVDFAVARFDAQGALLDLFGDDGVATAAFTGPASSRADDVVVLPNGAFVAAGSTWRPFNTSDFVLARYLADGTPDTTFGDSGIVSTDFGRTELALVVAVQLDGKLVAGGRYIGRNIEFDLALARYNDDGTLDAGFGDGGRLVVDFGATEFLTSLAVQPNGKILIAGWLSRSDVVSNDQDLFVARFNADGTLDATFGSGGMAAIDFGESERGGALILQPDGRIVVSGSADLRLTSYPSASVLARLNDDGSIDTTFGTAGKVNVEFTSGIDDEGFFDLAQYPDGRVIAFGTAGDANGPPLLTLARFLADGSPDLSFDEDGMLTLPLDVAASTAEAVLQPDGKILIGGTERSSTEPRFLIMRLNADGSPDSGFSGDAVTTAGFEAGQSTLKAIALTNSGQVLAAGYVSDHDGETDIAIAQFQNDAFIAGTEGDDTIFARVVYLRDTIGPRLVVWVNAEPDMDPPTHEFPLSSIDGLRIDAGGGNDTVTLETSGSFPRATVIGGDGDEQFFVTGSGTGSTLSFDGGPGLDTLTVNTVYSPLDIVFPIEFTGGEGDDALAINGTEGDDVFTFSSSTAFTAGNYGIMTDELALLHVNAGAGDDSVTIAPDGPLPVVTVVGGDGNDALDITLSTNITQFRFDGDAGDDVLTVREPTRRVSTLRQHFEAGEGNDAFRVYGTSGDDGISQGGAVVPFTSVNALRFDLAGVESEWYHAGDGDDSVSVGEHDVPVHVETGDGDDYFAYVGGTRDDITFRLANAGDGDDQDLIDLYRGDFVFDEDLGLVSPNLTVRTNGPSTARFETAQSFYRLVITGRDSITMAPGGDNSLNLRELDLSPTATLDLNDNDMHILAGVNDWPFLLRDIEFAIGKARNAEGGLWTGTGITSSAAKDAPLTGLAVWANDQVDAAWVPVMVKYTWNGDGTLDGVINFDDYFLIDTGYLAQPSDPLYRDGDFNYDGLINFDDYFLIDQSFLEQSGVLLTSAGERSAPDSVAARTPSATSDERAKRRRAPARSDETVFSAVRRVHRARRER